MANDKDKPDSVPPPSTDDIDDDWGADSSSAEKDDAPPWKKAKSDVGDDDDKAAKRRRQDDDDESDEDDDENEDDGDESDEDDDENEDDGDESDEDDEDDDIEEEDDARASEEEDDEDWIPDWAPWAVLIALILVGVLGGLGVFSGNAEATSSAADTPTEPEATATATEAAQANERERPLPKRDQGPAIEASHVLIMHKGSRRAPPTVTRSEEEAKKLAEEVAAKAKKGEDFGELAAEHSDEPGAKHRKGHLGSFTRGRRVKPFSDAAFDLKPGEISGVVETSFGFHVIKRTK